MQKKGSAGAWIILLHQFKEFLDQADNFALIIRNLKND